MRRENHRHIGGDAGGLPLPSHAPSIALPHTTRRKLLASVGGLAVLGPAGLASCVSPPSEQAPSMLDLQQWLEANATPVRSIDAHDEDFGDLEPLAQQIGTARIVQLGEPSHGAGACFQAKVRLIKFLHQRMGFDVLAWEAGFNDVEYTEAGLRAGEDAVAAARRGILTIWSASEECRPLFEYAKASHASGRPLTMAGFDMQFSSPNGFNYLPDELRSFIAAVRNPEVRREADLAASEAIEAFSGFSAYIKARATRAAALPAFPRRETLENLQRSTDELTRLFNAHPAAFAEAGDERKLGFMQHVVANLSGYARNLYEKYVTDDPAGVVPQVVGSNRRDALMAENLRWLIEKGYPGRKFIVWAHNAHVMDAYYLAPDFTDIRLEQAPDTMKPMGVFLKGWYGDDVYTIGCTAYDGDDAMIANPKVVVAPARENSLEERLHRLGTRYAFLDLQAARNAARHPLRQLQTARIPKYDEIQTADVTRPYDGLLFIAQMRPATLINQPATK